MKAAGFFKNYVCLEENKPPFRLVVPLLIKSVRFEVGLSSSGYLYLLESSIDLIIG